MDRRRFLQSMAGLLAAGCTSGTAERATPLASNSAPTESLPESPTEAATTTLTVVDPLPAPPIDLPDGVFGLGVASGAPTAASVLLWTRFVGDLPDDVPLVWEVSEDEQFGRLIATGDTVASATFGHSVHVDVTGLASNTSYWYRFRSGEATSVVGRTKTVPETTTDIATFSLGFSSCQLIETGYFAAHRDMATAPIDAVVWLGDFIYEYILNTGTEVRTLESTEAVTLAEYRARYAVYRSDELLQLNSAAHPWFVTWDDHEVLNDYDQSIDRDRQRAAYQAWWENMPVRIEAPIETAPTIYNATTIGSLIHLIVLDCRQDATPDQLLSPTQWEWFEDELATPALWTVVASSLLVSGTGIDDLDNDLASYTWIGHPADRNRLAASLATVPNPILVSGDMHTAMQLQFLPNLELGEASLATEFMAPAISSPFPAEYIDLAPFVPLASPSVEFVDPTNGWLELTFVGRELVPVFHFVDDVADPASSIRLEPRRTLTAS